MSPTLAHSSIGGLFVWIGSRLQRRFLLGTAAGVLISLMVFFLLFIGLYRTELGKQRTEAATQVNRLLRVSLENAMLKRDLDGLRQIVAELGRQENIASVMITNPRGEIRFSSRAELLGRSLGQDAPPSDPGTRFMTDAQGREVLRSVNPVYNKPICGQCHGPMASNPVNGILYVDYNADRLRHDARSTTLLLMGSGALIVLINIAGGWWFIRRYVLVPLSRLSLANEALSQGDLNSRVDLKGRDELARLGTAFNRMAENLQTTLRRLSESEAFLESLVDAIPDGVRVIDAGYRVRLANRTYREQLGIGEDEALGLCHQVTHGRCEPCPPTLMTCPLHETLIRKESLKVLHRHLRKDGSFLDVEIHASPMLASIEGKALPLVVESIRDLEKDIKYSQEQRLSELGLLAAGVAHEIYNPLSSLRMAMHAMREGLAACIESKSEANRYFEIIDREVDKCIEVTESLLRLSMPPVHSQELVDLATALGETLGLLKWEAGKKGIEIVLDIAPGLRVLARDTEVRMVALNLSLNAFHAMPEGGRFEVSAIRAGNGVELRFKDNGAGIEMGDQKHIFDPFFSRRIDGTRGSGLGLSITRSIVECHGGTIHVWSKPGAGSCFFVRMPDPDAVRQEDESKGRGD
ncbi:MAG: HAMP domain-containing protein [Gammaproteobacteria bacterium]|nr:HAMP domain-containing protein [Gammaproteobacteria bacterium]MBU1653820.1 HAMP domain-containing protein [Gammaproteobacteria bacterium]MBU1962148.1 HAMP domain-containing protein [Gammaproteobacteria bacterium]